MAEGLLNQYIKDHDLTVQIGSAGIIALVGQPAHPFAQSLMQEHGIDITGHRARQLTPELVVAADLVLVMDEEQRKVIENITPFARGRIHTLGKWSQIEIPDPMGKTIVDFEHVLSLITHELQDWQLKLWKST